MSEGPFRIGVVAPASPIKDTVADKVKALAENHYGRESVEISFHPQCFEVFGHFAGPDARRAEAFLDFANDPTLDAVWFARGGYGSGRILRPITEGLKAPAGDKSYMGYSDMGALFAGLMREGFSALFHGPMPVDVHTSEEGPLRALKWLVERDTDCLEPHVKPGGKYAAFNFLTLGQLLGTPWQPDLEGYELMLEDVGEYLYRIDRSMFQLVNNPGIQKISGLRLGRISSIPENDRPFGEELESIVKHWCSECGITFLGSADIGHDPANKIVPMGTIKEIDR